MAVLNVCKINGDLTSVNLLIFMIMKNCKGINMTFAPATHKAAILLGDVISTVTCASLRTVQLIAILIPRIKDLLCLAKFSELQ